MVGHGARILSVLVVLAVLAGTAHAKKGGGSGGGGSTLVPGVVAFTGSTAAPGVWILDPVGDPAVRITPAGESWVVLDTSRGPGGAPITVLARRSDETLHALQADGTGGTLLLAPNAPAKFTAARFNRAGTAVVLQGNDGGSPPAFTMQMASVVRGATGEVIGLSGLTPLYATSHQIWGLDVTADDGRVVFSELDDLWALDLSTLGVSRLTNTIEKERWPRCSPMAARVAFESWPQGSASGEGGVIATLDLASGGIGVITTSRNRGSSAGAYLSFPNWSPDGQHVLYHGHDATASDLWWIASDGSGRAANLTGDGAATMEMSPAWGW
jgi:hypothetical protein